jgi:glutamate carboxypeptidase
MQKSLIGGLLLWTLAGACSALEPREQAIVDAINARQAQALALLRDTVEINSGTLNLEGVRAVGARLEREFAALGMQVSWVEGAGFERAGHLVARAGSRGPRLLLIGHLDTVFPADGSFTDWEDLGDGRVRAPGITDMKGGNVVILEALRALRSVGVLDQLQVRVVLTGDEEDRGRPLSLANRALVDAAQWADIAIGFEDGDGDPATAVIARRGSSSWTLRATGRAAHSSQIFREGYGYGAAFELARVLNGWREALADEANLTFNPGLVMAGTEMETSEGETRGSVAGKRNVIARQAVAAGGVRALSPEQLETSVALMRKIAADSLPGTRSEFVLDEGYPPMPPTAANRELLALYSEASVALGLGEVRAVDPRQAGAADVSFAAPYVDAALDGIGMMGTGGHTVEESADLATLTTQTQRAALFLLRLAERYPAR